MAFLRMTRPTRRQGSSHGQFRQRIPLDLLGKVRGLTLDIPVGQHTRRKRVGERADVIGLSLETSDRSEILERHAAVVAYLERVYRALREETPTVTLTHKEAVQLSGEFYRAWGDEDRDGPALEYSAGGGGIDGPALRPAPNLVSSFPDPDELHAVWDAVAKSAAASDLALGPLIDRFLLNKGLKVTDASRETVMREAERALRDAFENRRRNAGGDHSFDPKANRFGPPWEPRLVSGAGARFASASKVSLTGLVDVWRKHSEQTHVSQSTISAYTNTMKAFAKFLGHSDARRVTRDDVERYREHRLALGRKPKTVKASDLSCLSSVFSWAVSQRLLPSNPAQGVTVRVRQGPQKRQRKGFSDAEAQAVLTHAWNYRRTNPKEGLKLAAAKRWVPWLCAYSGTRVGEMAQLRKQDIRQGAAGTTEGGLWLITISHEAATQKRKATWDIPIHPHLVEMGFIEFWRASADGHLFLTPRPDRYRPDSPESRTKDERGILGPLQGVKNRLREFAREVVSAPDVQPNHGWRHRFKTVGRECGIEKIVLDAFAYHEGDTVSDGYGEVTMRTMLRALEQMPRYTAERRS